MNINITCPEAVCSRCNIRVESRPQTLILDSVLSKAPGKFPEGFSATDEGGSTWIIVAASLPFGWTKGPNDTGTDMTSGLCASCTTEWQKTIESFRFTSETVEVPAGVKLAPTQTYALATPNKITHTPTKSMVVAEQAFQNPTIIPKSH